MNARIGLVPHADTETKKLRRTFVSGLEIGVLYCFALVYIWHIAPLKNGLLDRGCIAFMVIYTVASHIAHKENLKSLGFRVDNIAKSGKEVGLFTLIPVAILAVISGLSGNLHPNRRFLLSLLTYPAWGLVQQYAFQSFISNRLRDITKNIYAIALVNAVLFGLVHLPNLLLAGLCFGGGFFLSLFFLRHPNLFTISICHGIIGSMLGSFFPMSMRVGPGFYK